MYFLLMTKLLRLLRYVTITEFWWQLRSVNLDRVYCDFPISVVAFPLMSSFFFSEDSFHRK
jgi:hypothetical protein